MTNKYENIFNHAPVSIWEEDWSAIKVLLDQIREIVSPNEIITYFNNHPEFVEKLAHSIKVVRVNNKTLELYEADSEKQILSSEITKTFFKSSPMAFKQKMAALYRGDTHFSIEAEKLTLKGNLIYVLLQVGLPSDDEDYSSVVVTMVDITPTKVSHQRYLDAKSKFHKSFYQGLMGMIIVDVNGKILEVNDSLCKFIGYSVEELVKMNILDLKANATGIHNPSDILKVVNNEESLKMEVCLTRKNGNNVWAYVGLNLFRDELGKPLYFVGQLIDIDEAKQNAIFLEQNVHKYKQLLDSTNAAYLVLNEDGIILEFSENFLSLFNKTREHECLLGKSFKTFVSTESIETFNASWKKILKGQTVNAIEISLTKREAFKWVSLNASLFQNGGKKIFVLLTDISERKRKEFEKLISREKSRDKIRIHLRDIRNVIERIGSR